MLRRLWADGVPSRPMGERPAEAWSGRRHQPAEQGQGLAIERRPAQEGRAGPGWTSRPSTYASPAPVSPPSRSSRQRRGCRGCGSRPYGPSRRVAERRDGCRRAGRDEQPTDADPRRGGRRSRRAIRDEDGLGNPGAWPCGLVGSSAHRVGLPVSMEPARPQPEPQGVPVDQARSSGGSRADGAPACADQVAVRAGVGGAGRGSCCSSGLSARRSVIAMPQAGGSSRTRTV